MTKIIFTFLFLNLLSWSCLSYTLNYTLYRESSINIYIPGSEYQSEDPFSVNIEIKKIMNQGFDVKNMNLSTLSYSEVIPNAFCYINPISITLYPLIAVPLANTTRNFEFMSIDNFIYYYDTNRNLLIYYLNRTEDNVILGLTKTNEYSTLYSINEKSLLRFFKDKSKKQMYLVIDNACKIYSVEKLAFPIFIISHDFKFRDNMTVTNVDYGNGCFVFLFGNKYVDLHCFNSINSGFDVTQSLLETNIIALLKKTQATNATISFNYTDLLIDEGNILIISDFNIGLIVIDLNDPANPKLMGIYDLKSVTIIRKFYQSLTLIRQFENGAYNENHFEEYYSRINVTDGTFSFTQNGAFLLDYTDIEDLHIARNYVILFQKTSMRLYRHSISDKFPNNLYPLQGFLTDGILNVHRFEGDGDKNLFVAVFPNKLAIYNIDILNISLTCNVPKEYSKGHYLMNTTLITSFCSLLENNTYNFATFPMCAYQIPILLNVYEEGTRVSEEDKTGLIVGLVVGLFFAVVLILICACYLVRLTRRYDHLEETKKGQQVYLSGGGVIGGYEESEKQSNEPNKVEFPEKNQNQNRF